MNASGQDVHDQRSLAHHFLKVVSGVNGRASHHATFPDYQLRTFLKRLAQQHLSLDFPPGSEVALSIAGSNPPERPQFFMSVVPEPVLVQHWPIIKLEPPSALLKATMSSHMARLCKEICRLGFRACIDNAALQGHVASAYSPTNVRRILPQSHLVLLLG